jgi:hypothetical protein
MTQPTRSERRTCNQSVAPKDALLALAEAPGPEWKCRKRRQQGKMRFIALTSAVITLVVAPCALPAAPGIIAPNVTVGRYLQTFASVRLEQQAPPSGLQLTVTSDDPSRLLLSTGQDKAGSATISITVAPYLLGSLEFCIQGMADSGTVTYTVSAGSLGTAKGTVTLTPSAILILGPHKASKLPTTPGGFPEKMTIVSAALDSSRKVAGEQQVAGGLELEVTIANSNPNVGNLGVAKLTLAGGESSAVTSFKPAALGETSIAPIQPPGFTVPAQYASVEVAVGKPGLAPVGEVYLGKDLQLGATLCLGEAAPPGGLKVTLTSADGSKLLLSTKADQVGSPSITLNVPAGQLTENYYLQGLGDAGVVTYDTSAPGFRSTTARIGLTPSGFIIAYEGYGPPPEANVIQKGGTHSTREFYVSLASSKSSAKEHPIHINVYSVHLDPESGRAADITVQPLRAGVSATVVLASSDPAVATVESSVTINSGSAQASGWFTPMDKGKTVITINTPAGFSTPQNATAVPATVSN